MRKITFNTILYWVWCIKFERDIPLCSSHAEFRDWLKKDTLTHFGDCTKKANTCMRCKLNEIEIIAQQIMDSLHLKENWCGKDCIKSCNYQIIENKKEK